MIELFERLPTTIVDAVELCKIDIAEITEIRLRNSSKISLTIRGQTLPIDGPLISKQLLEDILLEFCQNSMAAFEEEIAQGFVTISGGHRVGIGGEFYYDDRYKKYILKEISSLNIRIARKDTYFLNQDKLCIGEFKSVLLSGAPHSGKTSLARCYIKTLAEKYRVVVCDEREELMPESISCDVIKGTSKAYAISMATRTLNPQFIVCDEIGSVEETAQILSAINTGVKFICTAHGESVAQLQKRPNIKALLQSGIFDRIVFLKQRQNNFYIEEIIDV